LQHLHSSKVAGCVFTPPPYKEPTPKKIGRKHKKVGRKHEKSREKTAKGREKMPMADIGKVKQDTRHQR
jgi:hypothetical protein